jgi:serine phosphatase RsbU (regulator of sigma subunit)
MLVSIGRTLKPVDFNEGELVFSKGDPGTSMYIITEGRVCAHDGQGHVFVEMGPGQFFGEYALLDTEARSAFITAVAFTKTLVLQQNDFFELLGNNIEVVKAMLRLFTKRLRENNLLQEELAASNRKIQQQNEEIMAQKELLAEQHKDLEDKNKKITASITYAKRIQSVMLPEVEFIQEVLPEVFILYKPRDIVSGDFYWFANAHQRHYFVVADCTGHGVPGALMSMTGAMLLNHIVKEKGIKEVEVVLAEMHKGLANFLKARETNVQDGMDMAICAIRPNEGVVEFAGAKLSLMYVKDGVCETIKADREPIGGSAYATRDYQRHVVPIYPGATYYMSSDGYADQFSNDGRKFMKKRLREVLEQVHSKDVEEQKNVLDQTIEAWRNGAEQTDDILIAGFRIN